MFKMERYNCQFICYLYCSGIYGDASKAVLNKVPYIKYLRCPFPILQSRFGHHKVRSNGPLSPRKWTIGPDLMISPPIFLSTCGIGELLELGRVDLLELGPNEEAGDPDELETVLRHAAGDAEEAVQEVHRQVKGLPVQPVLLAHFYQPV